MLTALELGLFVSSFDPDHDGRRSRTETAAALVLGAVQIDSDTHICGLRPPTSLRAASRRY